MKNTFFDIKKIKNLCMVFAVCGLLQSCNEDSFQQVVEFEIPAEPSRLVVNCDYLSGADSIQVFVGKSWNTTEVTPKDTLKNVKIELLKDGQKILDIPFRRTQVYRDYDFINKKYFNVGTRNYHAAKVTSPLIENQRYTLRVSAPGFETIEASCAMPKAVKIDAIKYVKDGFKPITNPLNGGSNQLKNLIEIAINDPVATANYYNLQVSKVLKDTIIDERYTDNEYFSLNTQLNGDVQLTDENDFLYRKLFSDQIFNGKKLDIKIGVGNSFNNGQSAVLEKYQILLLSISKEQFLFSNSIDAYYNNQGNPFGEQIPLYTNFDKGFGLFTLYNFSSASVKP